MHITKWNRPTWKDYILYSEHSEKGETMETVKRSMVASTGAKGGMNTQSTEDF